MRGLTSSPCCRILDAPSKDMRPEPSMKTAPSLSRRVVAVAVLGAAAIISCTERASVTPPIAARDGSLHAGLVAGQLMVCKKGGSPGTYSFHVDIAGGGSWTIFS